MLPTLQTRKDTSADSTTDRKISGVRYRLAYPSAKREPSCRSPWRTACTVSGSQPWPRSTETVGGPEPHHGGRVTQEPAFAAANRAVGLPRVIEPAGVLPQAADKLDTTPRIGPDEVRIRVERLNLDAASFRQLYDKHDGNGDAVR